MMTWEEQAAATTPQELRNGHWYKRDDLLAPCGPGTPNGVKVRQLVWLLRRKQDAGHTGVMTGGSVLAPQNARTAMVAQHYGMPCLVVLGGTTLERAIRNPNVALALQYGASFAFAKAPYNPVIQGEITRRMSLPEHEGWYRMPYGISMGEDEPDHEIAEFHRQTAEQVRSIPEDVHTLMVSFGSGNATASIVQGLMLGYAPQVKTIHLIDIAPDRQAWFARRMAAIARAHGLDPSDPLAGWDVHWHDLHGDGLVRYRDRRPATRDGIVFHPTYEGKVMQWLDTAGIDAWDRRDGGVVFWIIGGPEEMPNVKVDQW